MSFDWYSIEYVGLIPLGLIGFLRWGHWLVRKLIGFTYKARIPSGYSEGVSIVSPVYNESPEAFEAALDSWIANRPREIIAVIDQSDVACAELFRKKADEVEEVDLRLFVTGVPGKRPALALGVRSASQPIVALIDSDTLWEPDSLPKLLAPFEEEQVAGVTCRQAIFEPKTLAQKLQSLVFELRYADELPFLARTGHGFSCLSGRTALYRREALTPLLDEMVNETFWGRPCISGEDKRLTYLLQSRGHLTRYQDNVTVTTFAPREMGTFLKQKLRWTRNSWRADLRALSQRWTWKRPALAYFLFDKCISAFTTLIAPLFFTVAMIRGETALAGAIVIWWLVSRAIKALPYLHKYPRDIWIVPVFVVFGFLLGLIRIFALVTLNRQGWLTRQQRGTGIRPAYGRAVATLGAYAATSGVLALLVWMVTIYRTWAVP